LFSNGRIALIGTIAELGRQVLGGGFAVEVECRGGADVEQRLAAISGVRSVVRGSDGVFRLLCDRDVRPEAAAAVVHSGGQLIRLGLEHASLEHIYTRYFQNAEEVRHAA
jgi:ABC-2 type transport system ATP-binding protein